MERDFKTNEKDTTSKSFRMKNCKFLLTYKTHLNKEEYIKFFYQKFCTLWKLFDNELEPKPFEFIRLAHESGSDEKTPYNHTHVVILLNRQFETTNPRWFDYNDIHPHIACINKASEIHFVKRYIAKEDPDNADLKNASLKNAKKEKKENRVKEIWSYDTVQDALVECAGDNISNALGVIKIFEMKPNVTVLGAHEYPNQKWQTDLIEETKAKCTPREERKIIWYYDEVGNTGKSTLTRYLHITEPKKWYTTEDMGSSRDAATVIKNAVTTGWIGHGMIIDLPRQARNKEKLYVSLESIKNGKITSQKYNGCTITFQKPHLIVFANWLPKTNLLSRDRWDIRRMTRVDEDDFNSEVIVSPISIKDACLMRPTITFDEEEEEKPYIIKRWNK